MLEKVIKAIQEWVDEIDATEEQVRTALRQVLPSCYRIRETGIGLFNTKGFARNYVQIVSTNGDRFNVYFWERR